MFQHHRVHSRAAFRSMTQQQVDAIAEGTLRAELQNSGGVKLLPFADVVTSGVYELLTACTKYESRPDLIAGAVGFPELLCGRIRGEVGRQQAAPSVAVQVGTDRTRPVRARRIAITVIDAPTAFDNVAVADTLLKGVADNPLEVPLWTFVLSTNSHVRPVPGTLDRSYLGRQIIA